MRKGALIIVVLAVAVAVVMLVLAGRESRREGMFFAMGGVPVNIVAYDRTKWEFTNDRFAVEAEVDALENIFSRYRLRSEVFQLNDGNEGCIDQAAPALIAVLTRSRQWRDATGGAFDVTVGPLVDLWKAAAKEGRIPRDEEIDDARARVGMEYVEIADQGSVCLERPGMSVDLGGIAKGNILDSAAYALKRRGVARGLVDAGGDVAAFGDGTFRIGIQDPLNKGALMGVLTMPAGGVVTSGDYERFVTIGGMRYSHIIDPRTGMPAEGLTSVTVVGPNATDADALATAISVMGKDEGIELLGHLPAFQALIVEKSSDDYTVWCSQSLAPRLELDESWQPKLRTFD